MKLFKALLAISVLITVSTICASAENEPIVSFNLSSSNCGSKVINSTTGNAVLSASANGIDMENIVWDDDSDRLFPRMQGKKSKTGWNKGAYWQIELSTVNIKDIHLSAEMFSTSNAPKNFELQYSFDGTIFKTADNSGIFVSSTPQYVYNKFSLPKEIEDKSKLYIRITVNDNMSVKGNSIVNVKDGSTYINHISIFANAKNNETENPELPPEQKPENKPSDEVKVENPWHKKWGTLTGKYHYSVNK